MEKINTLNSFQYLWAYSVSIYALLIANISWGWSIPQGMLIAYIGIISLLKLTSGSLWLPRKTAVLILILMVYVLLNIFVWENGQFIKMVTYTIYLMLMSAILLSSKEEKELLLDSINNCFIVILLISVPAWILFLMGFPFSHSGEIRPDDFHVLYDYKFFLVSVNSSSIFPRFQSVFTEPGQFATPCAFLYFLNGANFSRKNILLIIGILLSFSLVSYGLLIAAFISSRMFQSQKYRFLKTMLSVAVVAGISFYFANSENEDDPVTALIVNRLQYDEEKGISGYNRTGSYFDSKYEQLKTSEDWYWGIQDELKEGEDWTYNASGYKKAIVHRGIIGFGFTILIIFLLFYYNRNLATFSFFMIVLTAYLVRDLVMSALWLSISIVGFYLLKELDEQETDELETSELEIVE
ncbi:MAG: hypothetical protein J6W75_00545 [Bacteroidaceae bacterium]|nr:hypothetical protein [Bacteroidaceae bacterium]